MHYQYYLTDKDYESLKHWLDKRAEYVGKRFGELEYLMCDVTIRMKVPGKRVRGRLRFEIKPGTTAPKSLETRVKRYLPVLNFKL
jgi:hypothetical protein